MKPYNAKDMPTIENNIRNIINNVIPPNHFFFTFFKL